MVDGLIETMALKMDVSSAISMVVRMEEILVRRKVVLMVSTMAVQLVVKKVELTADWRDRSMADL